MFLKTKSITVASTYFWAVVGMLVKNLGFLFIILICYNDGRNKNFAPKWFELRWIGKVTLLPFTGRVTFFQLWFKVMAFTGKLTCGIIWFNFFLFFFILVFNNILIFFLEPFNHLRVIKWIRPSAIIENLCCMSETFYFVVHPATHQKINNIKPRTIDPMCTMNAYSKRPTT